MIKGVFFDIGGVVVASPLPAIFQYERKLGIPTGTIARVIMFEGKNGAFQRLERSEISISQFCIEFEKECAKKGANIDGKEFIDGISKATRKVNQKIIEAIGILRKRGLKTCAITNNWYSTEDRNIPEEEIALKELFDEFVESRAVGVNKPDPRIYEIPIKKTGLKYSEVVFLDDLGPNLKSASELGMKTIKVINEDQALNELEALVGFPLRKTNISKL